MSDAEIRERLKRDLDATIFVEAGAGTGKTTAVVSRIVELVARGYLSGGASAGSASAGSVSSRSVSIDALAAITFTEAAAAELRDRIRAGLEEAAAEPGRAATEREACRRAAAEVELAAIQTIHSFSGTLLRMFPLEAGLPPGFATWDEIQAGQDFEERFRTWLYDDVPQAADPGRREAVRRSLLLGMTPDRLRALARALPEHDDGVNGAAVWEMPEKLDALEDCRALGAALRELEPLLNYARNDAADALAGEVRGIQFLAERMAATEELDEALRCFLALEQRTPRQMGAQKDWMAVNGVNAAKTIKDTFREAKAVRDKVLHAYRTAALAAVLHELSAFTSEYAGERKRLGVATFHDLLAWARNLLRDHPQVRRRAHERYRRIFVDEFQDTDPLQAQIVCLLAGDPAQADERDWRLVALDPGVLFLVGDPKQSIYRFRGADMRVYEAVYGRVDSQGGPLRLVQNFRSLPAVLDWVNAQLARDMVYCPGEQAAYVPLEPQEAPSLVWPPALVCGVSSLGGRVEGKAAVKWQLEAATIARLAQEAVDQHWQVSERDVPALRDACYGDICVLLPGRTNLRRLERAFEEEGVPYRVESGTLTLQSQEVRDLLACLRAIDDPTDQVALAGALRSPAYACSDTDLLEWVNAGGRLRYTGGPAQAEEGCAGPVREALDSLRALHEGRSGKTAAATIEALIRERGLAVLAYGQVRPREMGRRLRYLVERARAFAAGGEPSLRAFLDWLDGLRRETFYDAESPTPETDENAVRVQTIHGAKGLEFPIVVLTGLGSGPRERGDVAIARGDGRNPVEVRCGAFETMGWDKGVESAMRDAEQVRLLYVAATRAREHLVLSLFHTERNCDRPGCHVERIERLLADGSYAPPRRWELLDRETARDSGREPLDERDLELVDETAWLQTRRERIAALANETVRTATSLHGADAAQPAEEAGEDPPDDLEARQLNDPDDAAPARPAFRGRGSTALGRAVHATLQMLDLATLSGLEEAAARAAREAGIEAQTRRVRALARRLADSPAVREAVATGRYWREVPAGALIEGVVLEGVIDLLFERPDGTLGTIDYKTDQIADEQIAARAERYRLQGGAYALAVEQATQKKAGSVAFVFAGRTAVQEQTFAGPRLARIVEEVRRVLARAGGAVGPRVYGVEHSAAGEYFPAARFA